MCDRFNRNSCHREVSIKINPEYKGVAYASDNTIVISANWFRDNPQDSDAITHECMHVVQNYSRYEPGWLVEGIADYARWKHDRNNPAANWSLLNFDHSQHYTNLYRITARFLAWCEKRYPNIVNELDRALRKNIYQARLWVRITRAKTTDQLWNEYSKHPNL